MSDSTRLTREELYELVWSEPMSRLAPKYGLSDVGLKKTCKRMRVPTPGLGYWRRKERGYTVRKTPLPKLPLSTPQDLKEVTFRKRSIPVDGTEQPSGPVVEQQAFESMEENRVAVLATLNDPHPLVARTVIALRKAKPDSQGYLVSKVGDLLDLRVSLATADRAMCIFDALLKALDSRGFATSVRRTSEQSATVVRVAGEDISIALSERIDKEEVKSTSIAAERVSRWSTPRFESIPTGQLSLSITTGWSDGIRRTWADGKKQRVEDCLNAFIVGLVAAAEAEGLRRLEREEWQRNRRAEEERRVVEARRKEEEAAWTRALDHAVDQWLTARHLRGYIDAVRQAAGGNERLAEDSELDAWIKWAERHADEIDPLLPSPKVPKDPEANKRSPYSW